MNRKLAYTICAVALLTALSGCGNSGDGKVTPTPDTTPKVTATVNPTDTPEVTVKPTDDVDVTVRPTDDVDVTPEITVNP